MNPKYEETQNLENISAITDKLVMDYGFLAELLMSKKELDMLLGEHSFELTGKFKEEFQGFVDKMRENVNQMINEIINHN